MLRVIYDPAMRYDGSAGGIAIFCPTKGGEINYNIVHSVVPEKNCDLWRMSVVNFHGDDGSVEQLTKNGAEWEMAIRLAERPDFIGGYNHGDEIGQGVKVVLDGVSVSLDYLAVERACSCLRITVLSTGFDPADPAREILEHRKDYLISESGVQLDQEVRFLTDVVLDGRLRSYLAMMPPLKHAKSDPDRILTDCCAFGEEGRIEKITRLPLERIRTKKLTVSGEESGYEFTMSVDGLDPAYPNQCLALLTDNGSHMNYHKMYIAFAGGRADEIPADTVWFAKTRYRIVKK